jgi:hypothetical protein
VSAKIPKGWRAMKSGEILRYGDLLMLLDGSTITAGFVGESVVDQSQTSCPYIRRIRAPRKHRFDGMTLREVLTELRNEAIKKHGLGICADANAAHNFAREVRRRDALRRARK